MMRRGPVSSKLMSFSLEAGEPSMMPSMMNDDSESYAAQGRCDDGLTRYRLSR